MADFSRFFSGTPWGSWAGTGQAPQPAPQQSAVPPEMLDAIRRHLGIDEPPSTDVASMTHQPEQPNPAAPYIDAFARRFQPLDFTPAHLPGTEPKDYLRELYRNPDILAHGVEQAGNFNFTGSVGDAGRVGFSSAGAQRGSGAAAAANKLTPEELAAAQARSADYQARLKERLANKPAAESAPPSEGGERIGFKSLGTASEGPERIIGASYSAGGKHYVAPNHVLAMDQAVKDLGLTGTSDLVDLHGGFEGHHAANGFMTSTGRVVNRAEADRIATAAEQGQSSRPGSLKSEDMLAQPGGAAVESGMQNGIRAFHGSPHEFEAFAADEGPHWFSESERTAQDFGRDRMGLTSPSQGGSAGKWRDAEPQMYEARINGKVKDIDVVDEAKRVADQIGVPHPETPHDALELLNWSEAQHEYISEAKNEGFDAVRFTNVADDPSHAASSHIAVINPAAINVMRRYTDIYAPAKYPPGTHEGNTGTLSDFITAYHGTPHDFDRFDLSKIGTGEGAQAYGHGLYFAENEGVAKGYRDTLAPQANTPEKRLMVGDKPLSEFPAYADLSDGAKKRVQSAFSFYTDKQKALDTLAYQAEQSPSVAKHAGEAADFIKNKLPDSLVRGERSPGKMYQVAIKAPPEHFLDWDKPLSEQPKVLDAYKRLPENIRSAIEDRMEERGVSSDPRGMTGADLHQALSGRVDTFGAMHNLREAGIPGIKYLDSGSRIATDRALEDAIGHVDGLKEDLAKETSKINRADLQEKIRLSQEDVDHLRMRKANQTRNYVVFDDKLIDILKKYGIAGIAALPAMNAYHYQDKGN